MMTTMFLALRGVPGSHGHDGVHPLAWHSLHALRLAVCDLMEEKTVLVVSLPRMTKKMLQLSVMMAIPAHQASVMVL